MDLSEVYELAKYEGKLKVYPGSMEIRDNGETHTLTSRTVCCVGIAESIEEARNISLEGIVRIDGPLWNRWDIASKEHIKASIEHMRRLRG